MRKLDVLAGALLIVGGLNWGLVAIAEFDLVAWIFSEDFGANAASRIVYGLVGVDLRHRRDRRSSVRGRSAHSNRLAVTKQSIRSQDATDQNHPRALCGDGCGRHRNDRRRHCGHAAASDKNIVETAVAAGKFRRSSLLKRAGLAKTLRARAPTPSSRRPTRPSPRCRTPRWRGSAATRRSCARCCCCTSPRTG